jgi:eukaryotic-like serine/threonine-protein kinase
MSPREAPYINISALSGELAEGSPQATWWPARGPIGPYQLLEPLGSGGMGEVWLAEQTQPVRRRVALKLIKAGMDTGEVVARFQSERQALALMDHPAIAKVFDAGTTPQGRPYFVMEYIGGVPITDYCDQHKLTLRARLELFVQVCEGVQHAHQKAIIHRDLKPSNILVSEVDGKPVPRIIDFGVAKALSHGMTGESLCTRVGAILGTPAYMSPEQAGATGQDVDTRSDVYSLGAVLYELLIGGRPLDFHDLTFDHMLRRLREDEPPRPSSKLRSNTALARQLRGDLDAIVLKALEKDRSRRYGSPSDLAADIGRYLGNEAVLAVAPSAAYRVSKFARRHQGALITAALFAVMLIVAAALVIRQSIRANSEAAVAQAVSDFLRNDLLAQGSPSVQWAWAPGAKADPDLRVKAVLDRAAARIAAKFQRQPEVEAAIRETIGATYMDLEAYDEARKQFERVLGLYRRTLGDEDGKTLQATGAVATALLGLGRSGQAEALFGQTLKTQRRVLGAKHPDTLGTMAALAHVYREQGRYPQAEALLAQVLHDGRLVFGRDNAHTLESMKELAEVYYREGKYTEAETVGGQALDLYRNILGPEHPYTTIAMSDLGNVYKAQGKFAQAEAIHIKTLEIRRRVAGEEHPYTMAATNNVAEDYRAEGKYAQAEALDREALEKRRRVLGPDHVETLMSMENLACDYAHLQKYPQAEILFAQTLDIQRRVLGPTSRHTLDTLIETASMYQRAGRYALAEKHAAGLLAEWRQNVGSESPVTMDAAAALALAYLSQAKIAQSEPLAREAVQFDRKNRADTWQRFRAESLLGASLAGQKKFAEAEPLLLAGYQGMAERKNLMPAFELDHLDRARQWLFQLYKAWGKPEKAAEWRKK